ncbi:MAG: UDP-3-O-acyl-N-acetylglucosamine deacetylase [Pseudomonadota bacterium]
MITVVELGSRNTIASPVTFEGIGLHTGEPSSVSVLPSNGHQGIRLQTADGSVIAASADRVVSTNLGTVVRGKHGQELRTIEHLLGALSLSGVDDATVVLDGAEVPILDGSAMAFYETIGAVKTQNTSISNGSTRSVGLATDKPFDVRDGASLLRWEPGTGRHLHVSIEFVDEAIGVQEVALDLDNPADAARVSSARTFCRKQDIDSMRGAGLALGGSLENAIVVKGQAILNENGLRDPLEFALHKALDVVGDIALVGAPLLGRIEAVKPGHGINTRFAAEVLSQSRADGFDPFSAQS